MDETINDHDADIWAGWVAVLDCMIDQRDPEPELMMSLEKSDPERYRRLLHFLLDIGAAEVTHPATGTH